MNTEDGSVATFLSYLDEQRELQDQHANNENGEDNMEVGGEEEDHLPQEIPHHVRQLDPIVTDELDAGLQPNSRKLNSILSSSNQAKSKKGATKTALKWFDNFLREYWADDRHRSHAPPNLQIDRLYDHLTDENLSLELMGTFCTYLCDTNAPTSRTGFLSWNSANSYLGQVISYHIDGNYKDHAVGLTGGKVMEVFGDGRFLSKSRSQMQKKISKRSKDHGIPLVIAKSGATELDWKIIAMSSVLLGSKTANLAEFWALSVAMTHFASRGKFCHTPF